MHSCLSCHKLLQAGEQSYHGACAKALFRSTEVPVLEYGTADLERIAAEWMSTHAGVTGVQPKLSLHWQKQKKEPRLTIVGAMEGQYILKTPHADYPHMPELEALCMNLARACGIPTVPFGLIPLHDGPLCFLTRRIDRDGQGRIAMEDMCQISERLTEDKYKGSHEQIARHIERFSKNTLLDLTRYYEVVLFSFLIGNSDMHLKNFSLFNPNRKGYELTPAYDLLSTQILLPNDDEDLALTIDGRRKKLSLKNFQNAMGKHFNPKAMDNLFERIQSGMKDWQAIAHSSFVPREMSQELFSLISKKAKCIGFSFTPLIK